MLALVMTVGLVMLGLAIPRLGAALALLAGDGYLAQLQQGRSVSSEDLVTLVASRHAALGWQDDPRVRTDLAAGQLLLRMDKTGTPADHALLDEAIEQLRQGLSRAPLNAYAWARLSNAEWLAANPQAARSASQLSLMTGRYLPGFLLPRIILAWRTGMPTDEEGKAVLEQTIRLAAQVSLPELTAAARQWGKIPEVRAALEGDKGILKQWDLPPYQNAP